MLNKTKNWLLSCDGATALEYVLIMAGIALAISAVTFTLGDTLVGFFTDLGETVDGAVK